MKRNNNNIIMIALVVIALVMGIAYAAFATTLNINGTAEIKSTWDIRFEAGTCTPTVTKDSGKASSGTISVQGTTATVTASMASPGDKLSCTVTAKNYGTLAAKRTSWTVTSPTQFFNVTATPATTGTVTPLAAKAGDTIASETLTITIEYLSTVTTQPTQQTFTGVATYAQAL